jgi:hypothetical protein
MVESDLPFTRQTANKLMKIARDKRLSNDAHGRHLPPSWTTFYQLSRLKDETFEKLANAIAAKLNERNVRTARGGKWTHVQVGAILSPFGQEGANAAA